MNPLHSLDAFIFDLDGVIWRGSTPIDGAAQSIALLKAAGRRCFYATNNSMQTPAQFAARLHEMGIEAQPEDVMTSSSATAAHLRSHYNAPFSCYVVGENGIKGALENIGAKITFDEDESAPAVDCVVVGIDRYFTYAKLKIAQRYLHNGALFVATNPDLTFPTENGLVPGAGSLVAAVAAASGKAPLVIGKPLPTMLNLIVQRFGLDANTTAMVGDRLDTDIACGFRAGLKTLFVGTGVHSLEAAGAAEGEEKPDAIFDDLPDLCARF